MEITFYVLAADAPLTSRLVTVCRLADKACQQNRKVHVQAASRAEAEALDELLWSFRAESFVPHHLVGDGPTPPPPVRIGWPEAAIVCTDILINLAAEIPPEFARCQRVIEVVAGTDSEREQARQHWREFKRQGYTVQAHELKV